MSMPVLENWKSAFLNRPLLLFSSSEESSVCFGVKHYNPSLVIIRFGDRSNTSECLLLCLPHVVTHYNQPFM